jgi:hypothetical protein
MTVIGALSSFRKRGEMSPHKRACVDWCGQLPEAATPPLDYFIPRERTYVRSRQTQWRSAEVQRIDRPYGQFQSTFQCRYALTIIVAHISIGLQPDCILQLSCDTVESRVFYKGFRFKLSKSTGLGNSVLC